MCAGWPGARSETAWPMKPRAAARRERPACQVRGPAFNTGQGGPPGVVSKAVVWAA